jgi:hypothetical protein
MNDNIIKDRAAFNVHFKQAECSYEAAFDKLLADGAISTRGLTKDPFIVDELIYGVNTAYFENGGALVAAQNPRRCSRGNRRHARYGYPE